MRSFLPILTILMLAACSPLSVLNSVTPMGRSERTAGIPYGEGPRHKLDIYLPKKATPADRRKVVIFFYGGGWRSGARGNYRFVGAALAERGYIGVIPDYRVFPEARFPAFVEDGAAAVAWVRANIARYGGGPDRIYLMGHSAGAHIAMLLTLDGRYLAAAGADPRAIKGTIGIAGPYAFDPRNYKNTKAIFAPANPPETARPASFASRSGPPLLLLHGRGDKTVAPRNSAELAAAYRAAGGEVTLEYYPAIGHYRIILAVAKPFRWIVPIVKDVAAFVGPP